MQPESVMIPTRGESIDRNHHLLLVFLRNAAEAPHMLIEDRVPPIYKVQSCGDMPALLSYPKPLHSLLCLPKPS